MKGDFSLSGGLEINVSTTDFGEVGGESLNFFSAIIACARGIVDSTRRFVMESDFFRVGRKEGSDSLTICSLG